MNIQLNKSKTYIVSRSSWTYQMPSTPLIGLVHEFKLYKANLRMHYSLNPSGVFLKPNLSKDLAEHILKYWTIINLKKHNAETHPTILTYRYGLHFLYAERLLTLAHFDYLKSSGFISNFERRQATRSKELEIYGTGIMKYWIRYRYFTMDCNK